MPETAHDQVFDRLGNVLSDTPRVVSDGELERRDAPLRLRPALAALATFAGEAAQTDGDWPTLTVAQKDAAQRLVIRRFGALCSRLRDLLLHLGLD